MKARITLFFHTVPKLALRLGAGLSGKGTVLVLMWFLLIRNQLKKTKQPVYLPLRFAGQDISMYIYDAAHIAALQEVYLEEEYRWCPIADPRYIIDIGAHIGDTTRYYHARFPNATIIAVEPSPDNFALLQKNCQGIPYIKTIQAAVSSSDGTLELHRGASSLGYSVKRRANEVDRVSVPAMTLTTLLKTYGVATADVIKFDIEGGEEHLFPNSMLPEQFASVYIGEVHTDLMGLSQQVFLDLFAAFTVETSSILSEHRFILKASRHVNV